MEKSSKVAKWLGGIIAVVAFLLLWNCVSRYGTKTDFPGPLETFAAFARSFVVPIGRATMLQHIGISLFRVLVGYILAGVSGILLGLGLARSLVFRALVMPVFNFLKSIPPIAWVPIAILWMGVGEAPKYFAIFIGGFAPFVLNTFAGAIRVEEQQLEAARMLGAKNQQLFWKVVFPATVPYIFTGAQIALSASWMSVIAAEMIKSDRGVGWIITSASTYGNYTQVFVGMIAIGIVGILIAVGMQLVERKLLKWKM